MEHWWNVTGKKEKYLEKKNTQVPVCPPQIPKKLSWFVAVQNAF